MDYGYQSAAAEEFPRYVMYDVNNLCNARCPFCPQSDIAKSDAFLPQHISWEDYSKTINEVAGYPVELVRLTGDGEPLLHPRIFEMIALAVELGISKVNLTTNGSLLSGKRLDALLKSPPHILDISLDAFTPESYAKYRVGLDFDTTMRNVHELLRLRDPERTKVILSIIHHPGMDAEVAAFREYWSTRADTVAVRKIHSNLGAVKVVQAPPPAKRWPCSHLWQRLVVDFRGHIRFCPIDWSDKSYIGDVSDMTLREAWHCEAMEALRQRHLQGNYRNGGVCEKCVDWASSPWTEGWIDLVRQPNLQIDAR